MDAYALPRRRPCEWPCCSKTATWDVFDPWNVPSGAYCGAHTKLALAQLTLATAPGPLPQVAPPLIQKG